MFGHSMFGVFEVRYFGVRSKTKHYLMTDVLFYSIQALICKNFLTTFIILPLMLGTEHLYWWFKLDQNVHQLALNQFGISNKMMQYRMQFGFAFLLPISKGDYLCVQSKIADFCISFLFCVVYSIVKKISFKIV